MVKKIIKVLLTAILALVIIFFGFVWFANYHPGEIEEEEIVCSESAPILQRGQKIKLLNWNVQYMAGKNYVFFYDKLDGTGPDERPSPKDIKTTMDEVARIIKDENPDLIQLQEIENGSKRTDYEDQISLLLNRISKEYKCYTSSFYHKSLFVPHPRIMGAVGMKLLTLSKYKMTKALRHQLALIPLDPVSRQFNLKRAVLEVRMPVKNTEDFITFNTHLDAFSQGTNTMELQVQEVKTLLKEKTKSKNPWLISGDFNLLPPGKAYKALPEGERAYYKKETEIVKLFDLFNAIPSYKDVNGPEKSKWFTHFPNGVRANGPDRTIDYIIYSKNLNIKKYYVRQHDTLKISDHLPIVAELVIQ